MTMTLDQALHAKAIELAKLAIRATTAAGSGHPTTALSLAHLTAVLMYDTMRWDPKRPDAPGADRLVLSEGHAVPIVYAACADLGVMMTPDGMERPMTVEDLSGLRDIDSILDGHPNPMLGFPFFDAATGSLGQGLSVAAGLAAAARIDGIPKTVYCIIGDGEAREGQVWEAMDFIADHKLTNVVAIFNCNTLGQSDFVSPAQEWHTLQSKAQAFGWDTVIIDGHDPEVIHECLKLANDTGSTKPLCVIARTVKGWGVPNLAGMGHHGTPVNQGQLEAALGELDIRAQELGVQDTNRDVMERLLVIQPSLDGGARLQERMPDSFLVAVRRDPKVVEAATIKRMLSPRRAFGLALESLGDSDPRVVALDADVKNSTYADGFARTYPDRYFEARIAEQNMVSVAAGLSSGGKVPFASTFGRFLERAFDQVEMAVIGGSNLKLVGTHVGVTLASDGPSQMALADVAFMRALAHVTDHRGNPAMTVLTPSDAVSAYRMTLDMAAFPSACYLRAVRADLPILYGEEDAFPFGGHRVLHRGVSGADHVVLVACGYLVHSCLKVSGLLLERGVPSTVVDAYSLPLQTDAVLALTSEGGSILVVEDGYVGGLASELSEAAAARVGGPVVRSIGVRRMPKSGRTAEDVLRYVGLDIADIARAACEP